MRNLIVCSDGTWNTPDQKDGQIPVPTNVVRLFNLLSERNQEGVEQLKYYHPGVGTEGQWWQKVAGGAAGAGLSHNIKSAYRWLCDQYQAGDQIFQFGFSRGAYTARSLAGMIGRCGLLKTATLPDREAWARVEAAYTEGYRARKPHEQWSSNWEWHGKPGQVPIHFLGVWDTVGALGVPNDMAILNLLDDHHRYDFHDTALGDFVTHARHAVALDERRASFFPTLWTGTERRQNVKQVWFPGVHCDVGGGYVETGLSDGALKWMLEEAQGQGLGINPTMAKQIRPNPLDILHNSRTGIFEMLHTQPRSVPLLVPANLGALLHDSALERQKNPPITQAPYRETCRLMASGDSQNFQIYATNHWNETGLYLEAGTTYKFEATGEWLDKSIPCGPAGCDDGKFHLGEVIQLAGTMIGQLEGLYKQITHNNQADFQGSRREEDTPWFALVGAIANAADPGQDGSPPPHEKILIGAGCQFTPEASGYLYCYANDAWLFYGNNRGSVRLQVTRL